MALLCFRLPHIRTSVQYSESDFFGTTLNDLIMNGQLPESFDENNIPLLMKGSSILAIRLSQLIVNIGLILC